MSKNTIEIEILSYLVNHPSARDTLNGIVEWWLLEQRIKTGIETVKAALDSLMTKGFVVVQRREGLPESYGVNRGKMVEIQEFISND